MLFPPQIPTRAENMRKIDWKKKYLEHIILNIYI